jgi:NAD(P)H-hydrate epimerase
MRLATVAESRRLDELTQTKYGVSAEVLMEAAGGTAAREIVQSFIPELRDPAFTVKVVCGPGNNGADGLVIARHLSADGYSVRVVAVIPDASKCSQLFRKQFERCLLQGIDCVDAQTSTLAITSLNEVPSSLIVDALFGIGVRGQLGAPFAEVVEFLNNSVSVPIVSIDTPSGLDCDRGVASGGGACVRAKMTITFGLVKPGFLVADGPQFTGRLRRLAIGFPNVGCRESAVSTFAFTESLAVRSLPRWRQTSNKSQHGHALILAGGPSMYGAGVLAATSAYRVGAGYVTLASHVEPTHIVAGTPEILTGRASDDRLWRDHRWTAAAIGPGLGIEGEATYQLLMLLKSVSASRVVVDADAITVASQRKLWPLPTSWILTPHAGELARILGVSAKEVENDRFHFAREGAKLTGCHLLLKGFRTVLASTLESGVRCTVVLAGNGALAKAGTGDVLTGIVTGLLAQGLPPRRAALTGAYIHGRIADEWVRSGQAKASLVASDVSGVLPTLLERLRSSQGH